jgi:disulfide bond formation protein DsbB
MAGRGHTGGMTLPSIRPALLLAGLAAGAALAVAWYAETALGVVPCALCLVERWPWRIAVASCLLGLALPFRWDRLVLAAAALSVFVTVVVAAVHVGVEQGLWPSPLPGCAAPRLGGGSIAERLASMPARPAKPCDEPTYVIAALPLSTAMLNLLYGLAFSATAATYLRLTRRSAA